MFSVLHCPAQVGGNPGILAKFERLIGLESFCISETVNPYAEPSDLLIGGTGSSHLLKEISRIRLVLKAASVSGVLHLNNGRFFAPFFGDNMHPKEQDLPQLIRWLIRKYAVLLMHGEVSLHRLRINQKAVFVTFQGSDARETNCFQDYHLRSGLAEKIISRSGMSDRSIRKKKNLLAEIVDKIYSLNPDLLEVLPKGAEFLPYSTEATLYAKVLPIKETKEVVIGHAPTHRITKGTDQIIGAVDRLRANGHKVRLELIEGLTKSDALKKYQEIDLFIDQLVIGWYGVVSLEVMALGKPVICFVKGKGLRFVPPQMLRDLPIINADEITLEQKILEVMKMDSVQRGNLAERGIRFLQKWHDPRKIAERVVADYRKVLSQRNLVRV
jgi:hypothetical protein